MNVLLQWHHQDPVSNKEIARNDSIYYKYQNNRNPFIDNPQWADSIWKIDTDVFVKEHELTNSFSVFPNPAKSSFQIINKQTNKSNFIIKITSITGAILKEESVTFSESMIIDCNQLLDGIYFLSIKSDQVISNLKFIKQ